MKFTMDRVTLLEAVSWANGAATQKSTVEVLSHVFLRAQDGKLTVHGTDTELTVTTVIPIDVQQEGMVTIGGNVLDSVLRAISGDDVQIDVDRKHYATLNGNGGRQNFVVYGTSGDGYPILPTLESGHTIEVSGDLFVAALNEVVYACSTDPLRYYLQGVMFERDGETGVMRVVATDSRRMGLSDRLGVLGDESFPSGCIVPSRALHEIIKVIGNGKTPVSLTFTDRKLFVQIGGTLISTSLIDGKFPDYKRVLPVSTTTTVTMRRDSLLEAVNAVSRMLDKYSPQIRLDFQETEVQAYSHSAPKGMGRVKTHVVSFEGSPLLVACNYRYAADALKALGDGDIRIIMASGAVAIRLERVDGPAIHVVMPMKMEEAEYSAPVPVSHEVSDVGV